MKYPLARTRNDVAVYVDLTRSPAGTNIAQQPHLLQLTQEALAFITATEPEVRLSYDLKRDVGYTFVIPTTATDVIMYARRQHEDVYSRFVKNGKALPTSSLSVLLSRDEAGEYNLRDVWLGEAYPARPGSPDEIPESKAYWQTHAYIFEGQSLQPRTVTRECPY